VNQPTAPRGTFDVLPPDSPRWQALEQIIDDTCQRYGYGEIRTPMFESTEIFVRAIGEGTDVVDKEMYTFTDRGGRSMTLRPELTAPTVRALLEHKLLGPGALKLYYRGPIFRYERPQKGRYRQAHQWGAECFGVAQAEADAEIIALGVDVVRRAGIWEFKLDINSMGCRECRVKFRDALVAYLRPRAEQLGETSRKRLAANPLRILDSKDPDDKKVLAQAPTVSEFLCDACRAHFERTRELLEAMNIRPTHNPRIVRGLDYYTRTVFEITSSALGSQDAICGGGRYDNLVEDMGGPQTPGVGLAMGIERLLMAAAEENATLTAGADKRMQVAFVALDDSSSRRLIPIMQALRLRGIAAEMDYTRRKIDKQLRAAYDRGARLAVIIGGDELTRGEATIQDLETRARERVKIDDIENALAGRL
jgi:histidyl-tRNA synthetase